MKKTLLYEVCGTESGTKTYYMIVIGNMKKLILISTLILIGCGPSNEERQEIAELTCNVMGASRNMDAAFRLKEINAAREKLGESVYLGSDEKIKESFEYGLCVSLVLDDGYDQKKIAIDVAIEEEDRKRREEAAEEERRKQKLIDKVEFAVNQQGISYADAIEQVLSEFNGDEYEYYQLVLENKFRQKELEIKYRKEELEQKAAREKAKLLAQCEQVIEGNDMLQFNLKEMKVSAACANVTVTLIHTGVMAAEIMGHNWVLTTDADFMPVATAAAGAGLANNYVPVGDDRVIAATRLVGGGEVTSVTFSIENLSAGDAYTFFCSFPGHYAIMKGSFSIL